MGRSEAVAGRSPPVPLLPMPGTPCGVSFRKAPGTLDAAQVERERRGGAHQVGLCLFHHTGAGAVEWAVDIGLEKDCPEDLEQLSPVMGRALTLRRKHQCAGDCKGWL